ncbi:hypothetical protein ACFRFQ_28880 [Rhodococcus sp. NPDC056743]|uniref:hypothetical protein n=1 Tax=Rhodococcus sp. NPDC056743 TaxID=3345934 RepID=UPI003670CE46
MGIFGDEEFVGPFVHQCVQKCPVRGMEVLRLIDDEVLGESRFARRAGWSE